MKLTTLRTSEAERYILSMLSQKYREGWLRRGIPRAQCETVGDHTMKVALAAAAYAVGHPELDANQMIRMALIHDAPEIIAPDYTPQDNITPEEKHRIESEAMRSLQSALGSEGNAIIQLWHTYELQRVSEARIVHQLDKIDPAVQALIYTRAGYNVEEFYPYARAQLTESGLIKILDNIVQGKSSKPYRQYYRLLRLS